MLQVRWSKKLLNRLESDLVRIVLEFRWLLGYFKVEYLSLFVSFDQIVASVELIFYYTFSIFASKALRIGFFGLFWVHSTHHFFPFYYRVTLTSISIDQYHHATFSAHHILEYIFKVWLIFMLVEEIDDLFFE